MEARMDALGLPAIEFTEPPVFNVDTLNKALMYVIENKGDDLILVTGYPFGMIWSERVVRLGARPLMTDELRDLLVRITDNPNAAMELQQQEDIDFSHVIQLGRGITLRFRVNATGCMGLNGGAGLGIVFRPITGVPKTMDELGMPQAIQEAALPKSGLVILCGPTGSGKTTALDAFMRAHATDPMGKHILTYYAPIENDLYSIPNQTGIIAQTEIGKGYGAHLKTFAKATRNSLRRHPMVIAYGEARDRETIEGAVLSAMTGHATYTTTHTNNVHMAIPRMADAFDAGDRVRISNGLIDQSRMIMHQRLLRRRDGRGRVPVRSWLVFTQDIRSHLLRIPYDQLPNEIQRLVKDHGRDLLVDAEEQYELGNLHEDEMLALKAELKYADHNS
jgi:Tfp pilus assembly pilus retraction ATPase PilT